MTMDWDKLRIFHTVADAGSFTAAGMVLNLSQSAISRQIIALEEQLKLPLFHRHARGLLLTEQGRILYNTAQQVHRKLEVTQTRLAESHDMPSGILKVNVPTALGSMWIAQLMRQFYDKYPDVEVHLICSDVEVDVAMLEADIAIIQHPPTSQGLMQKKIMHTRVFSYASVEYLERRGTPTSPEDLDNHNIIAYDSSISHDNDWDSEWLLRIGNDNVNVRRPVLVINNLHGMYRAVRAGIGIAALPEFMESLPGALVKVLPDEQGPEVDTYIVYPEEHKTTVKVQIFKDFLVEQCANKR